MKKIFCDICDKVLAMDTRKESYFTIKITSPFIDVADLKAHCCADCYDKLMVLLNRASEE